MLFSLGGEGLANGGWNPWANNTIRRAYICPRTIVDVIGEQHSWRGVHPSLSSIHNFQPGLTYWGRGRGNTLRTAECKYATARERRVETGSGNTPTGATSLARPPGILMPCGLGAVFMMFPKPAVMIGSGCFDSQFSMSCRSWVAVISICGASSSWSNPCWGGFAEGVL